MLEILKKKRDGLSLSKAEITKVIDGMVNGEIPDYQISAFLMALYFKGMTDEETAYLTEAVLNSGEIIDLSDIPGIKVDKHSSGGVGDKTTMILAPLVAAAGVPVAKMSGRGLGHTGGTIDKLESIPGFSVNLTTEEFIQKLKDINIAVCGQSKKLVPADKMLYALRDVTATVDSLPLITSSIMSKKLACGADAIVIDMKLGKGAYMKTLEDAESLSRTMIATGKKMDKQVVVLITAMDQPLGCYIGNSLEVKEAISTLKGEGPEDLNELCLSLGAHMLVLAEKADTLEEAKIKLQTLIDNGAAYTKFKEFISAQGGDTSVLDDTSKLPKSPFEKQVFASDGGVVITLDALEIGTASVLLGAGRENKESSIDLGAGIILNKKQGDRVNKGDLLATMFTSKQENFKTAEIHIQNAYNIDDLEFQDTELIIKTIS